MSSKFYKQEPLLPFHCKALAALALPRGGGAPSLPSVCKLRFVSSCRCMARSSAVISPRSWVISKCISSSRALRRKALICSAMTWGARKKSCKGWMWGCGCDMLSGCRSETLEKNKTNRSWLACQVFPLFSFQPLSVLFRVHTQ